MWVNFIYAVALFSHALSPISSRQLNCPVSKHFNFIMDYTIIMVTTAILLIAMQNFSLKLNA